MRTALMALLLAAAAALVGCQYCTDPTPTPALSDEPLGARCTRDAQCAAGLTCIDHTCTISCAGGQACPEGSICFSDSYCLASCTGDEACLLGHTAGACAGSPASPGYCYQRSCGSDGDCPVGRCAGLSLARGITWNDTCSDGTCMR